MKFKRILFLVLIFAFVLSTFAFADFTATDSSNLSNVKSNVSSIFTFLKNNFTSAAGNSSNTIWAHVRSMALDMISVQSDLHDFVMPSVSNIEDNLALYFGEDSGSNSVRGLLNTIKNRLQAEDKSVAVWADLIAGRNIYDGWTTAHSDKVTADNTTAILDLLNSNNEKQQDSLSDYSSSGGKSASDVSSDMGNISGSVSSNLDSGVSMDKALTAVDDNESYFHYFFFDMKDDLDTSGGGSSRSRLRSAPSSDSGSDVPDFLSDYWGGLNG